MQLKMLAVLKTFIVRNNSVHLRIWGSLELKSTSTYFLQRLFHVDVFFNINMLYLFFFQLTFIFVTFHVKSNTSIWLFLNYVLFLGRNRSIISKNRKPKTFMLDSKSSLIVVFANMFILNIQNYTYLKTKIYIYSQR